MLRRHANAAVLAQDWHEWNGSAYLAIPEGELKAKLSTAIKKEFDAFIRNNCGSGRRRKRKAPISLVLTS